MVKICTYNARGLSDFSKRKQLFALLKHKMLDIILIQETHAIDEGIHIWHSQWGGNIMYANGTSHSKGVLVLIRRGLSVKVIREIADPNGRYVISEIEVDDCQFVLCNLYAPNIDSPNFFAQVKQNIESFENRNIILGGDFNFVIDNDKDRLFSHCNNDKARDEFLSFAQEYELIDSWRTMHPDTRQYSCCRPNSDDNK